jgi:hypothetical protein
MDWQILVFYPELEARDKIYKYLLIQLRYDHDPDGPINNIRATYLKYMYYKEALYNFNNP